MAEFAATCMADDALVWWSELDEEVQGSWKLLKKAMISQYGSIFCGGSGEEAEKFVRAVRDKAVDEGKQKDNEWIVTYASSCLAGEALRWYTYLGSDTQENWKKLQQALLTQHPRDGIGGPALSFVPTPPAASSLAPAPKVTRRGRMRISNSSGSAPQYLSKVLPSNNRVASTSSVADALELEWSTSSDGVQTLSIPRSQIPGYDLLGLKWSSNDPSQQKNYLGFCVVDSLTNSTSISSFSGRLFTDTWKISAKDGRSDGSLNVSVVAGTDTVYPGWIKSSNLVWFSDQNTWPGHRAELFFEPI